MKEKFKLLSFGNQIAFNQMIIDRELDGIKSFVNDTDKNIHEIIDKLRTDIDEWMKQNPKIADEAVDYFETEINAIGRYKSLFYESTLVWLYSFLEYNLTEMCKTIEEYVDNKKRFTGNKKKKSKKFFKYLKGIWKAIFLMSGNNNDLRGDNINKLFNYIEIFILFNLKLKQLKSEGEEFRFVRNGIVHNGGKLKNPKPVKSRQFITIDENFENKILIKVKDYLLNYIQIIDNTFFHLSNLLLEKYVSNE